MATKSEKAQQDEAPKAAREAVNETETQEDEESYPVEWLVNEASTAVGYKPEEIAGALSVSPRKNLTIKEAQAATKTWLKAPVEEA